MRVIRLKLTRVNDLPRSRFSALSYETCDRCPAPARFELWFGGGTARLTMCGHCTRATAATQTDMPDVVLAFTNPLPVEAVPA